MHLGRVDEVAVAGRASMIRRSAWSSLRTAKMPLTTAGEVVKSSMPAPAMRDRRRRYSRREPRTEGLTRERCGKGRRTEEGEE